MLKYKSTSRFTLLVFVNGKIEELSEGQEIESASPVVHPFLQLIEPEIKVKKTYNTKKSKNLNKIGNIGDIDGNDAKPVKR